MSRAARRLKALLARDDVALHVCGPHKGYFYRPRQVLCAAEDEALVSSVFLRFGGDKVDRWEGLSREWRPETRRVKQPSRMESVDLPKLGLERWFLPPDIAIPGLIELVRQEIAINAPGSLGPNYLMFGEQWWGGEPDDVPEPLSEEEAAQMGLLAENGSSEYESYSVAVVDTGIDEMAPSHHPGLLGAVGFGPEDVDVLNNDSDTFLDEQAGHGTFISGIVRMRAPGVAVDNVRGLDTNGVTDAVTVSDLVLRLAEEGRSQVINLSLGGRVNGEVPGLNAAIDACRRHEVVVVAAAGNAGKPDEFYPAAHAGVIAVGAVESDDHSKRACFSNYGDWVTACAPGTKVPGVHVKGQWDPDHAEPEGATVHLDRYARWSGTSFAAPVVAGAIVAHMAATGMPAPAAASDLLANSPSGPPMLGKLIT